MSDLRLYLKVMKMAENPLSAQEEKQLFDHLVYIYPLLSADDRAYLNTLPRSAVHATVLERHAAAVARYNAEHLLAAETKAKKGSPGESENGRARETD